MTTNIFGVVRDRVTICAIALTMYNSLSPREQIWIDENYEKARNEYNKSYLEFTKQIQKYLKIETLEKAYHLIRSYYRGEIEDREQFDLIDLSFLKSDFTKPKAPDFEALQLTYLINSRLIKSEFPKAEFKETFGVEFKEEWTIEHTRAIAEIRPQFEEFFAKEANGGKLPEVKEGKQA